MPKKKNDHGFKKRWVSRDKKRKKASGSASAEKQKLVKAWYSIFVGVWGYQPKDFWKLTPAELWWLVEIKMPEQAPQLSESDWDELYELLD